MSEELAPPRGMRDFYPEDFRAREALFAVWRGVSALFGFQGYDAPVVETQELLIRKAGEEITEQIYCFEDKSGRKLALRPELTPSLARMIIARQGSLSLPLKWWAVAQCFRYERMTRGRKREHFQWNLDIVGEPGITAEAEVIGAAVEAMRRLGLTAADFRVRVGSRALLSGLLASSGIAPEHHPACYLALDKRGKQGDDEIKALLAKEGLTDSGIARVFDLMAIRSPDDAATLVGPDSPALRDIRELLGIAADMGIADFLQFDVSIVRGLGYYTGIVFEAFDTQGKFRAIFGGGRYDSLLTSLGGQPCPCVGLGFGDVVIQELLADLGRTPGGSGGVDYSIGYMDAGCQTLAVQIAAKLRAKGSRVDLALAPEKPKKFFARNDKLGASRAVFLGPDEVRDGRFKVKDMAAHAESVHTLEDL